MHKIKNLKTIQDVIGDSLPEISKLINRAELISSLNLNLKQCLKNDWHESIRVQSYNKGILTLQVESASYATQLQFSMTELLTSFRTVEALRGLSRIQVKIVPHAKNFQEVEQELRVDFKPQQPSERNIQEFKELANQLPDTEDFDQLRATLKRLAKLNK